MTSRLGGSALLLLLPFSAPVRAQPEPLAPEHLLLLFNRASRPSGELAFHYARTRGVPDDHIVALDVPAREQVSRKRYEERVVPALRRRLRTDGLESKIRCLVTFSGVPIRIGPLEATPQSRALAQALAAEHAKVVGQLDALIAALDRVGTARPPPPASASSPTTGRSRTAEPLERTIRRYETHRDNAVRRIRRLAERAGQARAQQELLQRIVQAEGLAGKLRSFGVRKDLPAKRRAAAERQREKLRDEVLATKKQVDALLAAGIHARERSEARGLIRRNNGLIGLLAHLDVDRRRVKTEDTRAAFDSELSLLWWDDYPRHAWMSNTLNVRTARGGAVRASRPVLMVSRLDGPSPAVVRRIIDESVAVERRGLTGKVYIDAHGLPAKDSYGAYDRKLRDLARFLSDRTTLDVTLDKKPALFAPGDCPQTALYCGWYSLAKYVDAFAFVPGAVGFHIASSEAVSLTDPAKRYWCKELLRDGVDATLGPVAEPYLHAFPDPRDFFGLLLTGKYSIVECYYYSIPMNSWMMLLVADPLYRPFAANPQLTLDDVFDEDVSFPPGPATRPARRD